MKMRAKLKLNEIKQYEGYEQLKFNAICKADCYPADGLDEDNTYAKFSPTAEFNITINNPSLLGQFKPGQKYYCDFTEAN